MTALLCVVLLQVDLALPGDPAEPKAPRTLAMRADPPAPAPPPTPAAAEARPFRLEDLVQQVVFRFDLGYAVDQGEPPRDTPLPADVRGTRVSTFADLAAGTKGLLLAPLSTYLAAHFFLDADGAARMAAVPSVFDAAQDGRALLVWSAWAQLAKVGPKWLQPLEVRAGRQFRYDLAWAHFDGLSVEYATRPVEVRGFIGRRVALYGPGSDPFALGLGDPGVLGGASVRLRPPDVPLTLGVDFLGSKDNDHVLMSASFDLPKDGWVRAAARMWNGALANWRAEARTRFGSSTTIALELDDKLREDWMYDYVVTGQLIGEDDPRRWLSLSRNVSRLRGALRAGAVLFDNWDVLLTAAFGVPHAGESSFLPRYFEVGGAVQARFSGGIEAGLETRVRRVEREDEVSPIPLEDVGALGERSFLEGTGSIKYSLGARRFTAEVQVFARRFGETPLASESVGDLAAGARFRVVGWAAGTLQLRGEYEVASIPDRGAGQLVGLQSLRVVAEATF